MTAFHKLTVSQIQRITSDSVAITFAIPDELLEKFQFQHGQFIQLRTDIKGEQVERSYSICTAPYERKLTVGIKVVQDGIFSNFANSDLTEGDEIEVSEPQGVFTHRLNSAERKRYLLIAAGSGITPILSILKMTLASETLSQCLLIYCNKTPESSMFSSEIDALKERYKDRFTLVSVFSDSDVGQYNGRISFEALFELVPNIHSIDEFFVCGPEALSVDLRQSMIDQGLAEDKAHIELFNSVQQFSESSDETSSHAQVSVAIDGETIEFIYDDPTRSILDIALDYDSDLPYGCQNGSCGSCQCKVISGSVEMEVNFALSQSEVDEGFVLLCQSRPTSQRVELDYDA